MFIFKGENLLVPTIWLFNLIIVHSSNESSGSEVARNLRGAEKSHYHPNISDQLNRSLLQADALKTVRRSSPTDPTTRALITEDRNDVGRGLLQADAKKAATKASPMVPTARALINEDADDVDRSLLQADAKKVTKASPTVPTARALITEDADDAHRSLALKGLNGNVIKSLSKIFGGK